MNNIFSNPQKYREIILNDVLIKSDRAQFSGKSFICVSFTRFCPVGCSFCFFSSAPATKEKAITDAFTEEMLDRFIQFANDSNLGYLLISGGGEPFMERACILKVVEQVQTDKMVLVTSGNWAKTEAGAATYLKQIYEAYKKRKTETTLVIRLSIDKEHEKVGLNPVFHLISLFEENYLEEKHFKLQFHTLFDDPCIEEVYQRLGNKIISVESRQVKSDAETILKVNPAEKIVRLSSGLEIKVGYAKRFYSNIKVNLNDPKVIERNLAVFQWDMTESEENNPSVVTNIQGGKGLDFWVNFNGNVTTWGNQVPDHIFNLYEDDYRMVVNGTFLDPISLGYLENGDTYRDRIINEVNPRAILRAKAMNIRDYTGAIICEEEKTRLYLSLRILQDYISAKRVTKQEMEEWPPEIRETAILSKHDLITMFHQSDYSIVDQYLKKPFVQEEWLEFFELIKLGHYDISPQNIRTAIDYYNRHVEEEKIACVDEVTHRRVGFFHEERIIAMKEGVATRYNLVSV